jgi:hypothetical protein
LEKHEQEQRDLISFPALIGVFIYFSAIIVAMAIYWQTGIWYQNSNLTNVGSILAIILVLSAGAFVGFIVNRRRQFAKSIKLSRP